MTTYQIVYTLIVAALWALKADRHVMIWITFNLLATLGAAGLMDIGMLERDSATVTMMIVDLATGAGLAFGSALSKLVAFGYALTIPLYSLDLIFGVSTSTTFAVVVSAAFAQLGVVCLDRYNGGGGYRRRSGGRDAVSGALASPRGNSAASTVPDGQVQNARLNG